MSHIDKKTEAAASVFYIFQIKKKSKTRRKHCEDLKKVKKLEIGEKSDDFSETI